MKSLLNAAGALVFGSIFAGSAIASPAMDAAFDLPGWSETCPLPSVTASSPITRDDNVQLVSDNQPAAKANPETAQESSSSCDSCSQCTHCCCPPACYASVGVVILHRDRPDAGTISATNPALTPISSGRDFDFGWDAGPDVTIGRRLANGGALEGRFFDIDNAEANISLVTPGNFIGPGFTGPGGTTMDARYLTQLYSSELNYRHPFTDRIDFLTGFRWIELKDDLRYNINNTVAAADYEYNNHLYGGQIGADWALTDHCSRLKINATGKAGLFGNVTDGGIHVFAPSTNPIAGFLGDDNTTAFVGELDFTAAYWLSCHMAIHGGYQLLWLDNLALAADAAARSLTDPTLLTNVDNDGHLFYHGAAVGIDFVW